MTCCNRELSLYGQVLWKDETVPVYLLDKSYQECSVCKTKQNEHSGPMLVSKIGRLGLSKEDVI